MIHYPSRCPICTAGLLLPRRRMAVREIGGMTTLLPYHYSICDTCGMEVGSHEDNKLNAEITRKLLKRMVGA